MDGEGAREEVGPRVPPGAAQYLQEAPSSDGRKHPESDERPDPVSDGQAPGVESERSGQDVARPGEGGGEKKAGGDGQRGAQADRQLEGGAFAQVRGACGSRNSSAARKSFSLRSFIGLCVSPRCFLKVSSTWSLWGLAAESGQFS